MYTLYNVATFVAVANISYYEQNLKVHSLNPSTRLTRSYGSAQVGLSLDRRKILMTRRTSGSVVNLGILKCASRYGRLRCQARAAD